MRTAKTLIRLGGCPGWSESSLGAQSLCWFCHEAAHFSLVPLTSSGLITSLWCSVEWDQSFILMTSILLCSAVSISFNDYSKRILTTGVRTIIILKGCPFTNTILKWLNRVQTFRRIETECIVLCSDYYHLIASFCHIFSSTLEDTCANMHRVETNNSNFSGTYKSCIHLLNKSLSDLAILC